MVGSILTNNQARVLQRSNAHTINSPTPNPCFYPNYIECRDDCTTVGYYCAQCSDGHYKCKRSISPTSSQNSVMNCNISLLPFAAVGQGGIVLTSSYVPPNLVSIQNSVSNVIVRNTGEKMNGSASNSLNKLSNYVQNKGYKLVVLDGYRSYEEQAQLYQQNPEGSAPPGNSEHQLGVAFDFELQDSNGKRVAMPDDIIKKADDFGMVHPISTDRPHFFVLEGTVANSGTIINNLQTQINNLVTFYSQMNGLIIDQQIYCGVKQLTRIVTTSDGKTLRPPE